MLQACWLKYIRHVFMKFVLPLRIKLAYIVLFFCRAQAKDTPEKKDTVPSPSPPTLQNGPVWSRTLVLDWILIILVLCERVPRAAFLYSLTQHGQRMDVNDCGRELTLYENLYRRLFLRGFIIYVEGHKNSIFADKGHSNF